MRTAVRLPLVILVCLLLVGVVRISAQTETPISVGENKTGELTDGTVPARFTLNVQAPTRINLQVLAITTGFAPRLQVLAPDGFTVLALLNDTRLTNLQAPVSLTVAGIYIVEVGSVDGLPGQFLLSAQPADPLPPPQSLTLGQAVQGLVDRQSAQQGYTFTGSITEALLLTVESGSPVSSPVITLRDSDTGDTLAMSSARLVGVSYRIPAGDLSYTLDITHSGGAVPESFRVCVGSESVSCDGVVRVQQAGGEPTLPPTLPPTLTPTATSTLFQPVFIPPTGACAVASASGATINVRGGPGTNFEVVGRLTPTATASVVGRLPDGTWYQVNVNGVIGWVSASVVTIGGNCTGIQTISTPAPTLNNTPTYTPPSNATATATATATSTATNTPTPEPVATLNFGLPPVFGSTALTSGFVPDPFTVGITGGGPANVAYLGGSCTGFTTSAPSFSVNFTSGAFPTLRFYFVGAGDNTMVINSPSGSYFCNDDSFGTFNPTIDFANPSTGRYDVWIGTFSSGGSIGGTLYVTENPGLHP